MKKSVKRLFVFLFILICGVVFLFFRSESTNFKVTVHKVFDEVIKNTKKYKECVNDPKEFTVDNFKEELKNKETDLKRHFNSNANFTYVDLKTDYTFDKSGDSESYAASVSKLPAVIYTYHLADEGKIDLNKELKYTSNYSHGGSGVIQKDKVGSKYTIDKLLEYAIKYSDNIAYFMILDQIGGTSNVKKYWENLGVKITYTDKFGNLSTNLGAGYLKEAYKYFLTNKDNAKKLYNNMKVSDNLDFIKNEGITYDMPHKYGWYESYYNDISIVMSNHPYILTITSTKGFNNSTKNYFLKAHKLALEFNDEYYKEKSEYCIQKVY
ncbi:MAG: serine hydrolase [Bacilli bacterium]|nr:serine hydrolase [Bacilli bacterium]